MGSLEGTIIITNPERAELDAPAGGQVKQCVRRCRRRHALAFLR